MRQVCPVGHARWRGSCAALLVCLGNACSVLAVKSNCAETLLSNNAYAWKPKVCVSAADGCT